MQADDDLHPFEENPRNADIQFSLSDFQGSVGKGVQKVGRYHLKELLGRGGMGQVYAAYDPLLKREVALKLLNQVDPLTLIRFVREAQFQARLNHPCICRVYEVDAASQIPFIAMERIHGADLLHAEPMSLSCKLQVMVQIAEAVHAAHEAGLIHRDLKPSNILLENDEGQNFRPRILDFGLAKDLSNQMGLTTTGMLGTPAFMSPEQAMGKTPTVQSDIYALGATFYAFLTGQAPFHGYCPAEALIRQNQEDPPSLCNENPHMPKGLGAIIFKCMEKTANGRYSSAKDLAEDLRRLRLGEAVQAKTPSPVLRWLRKLRRGTLPILGAALLILAMLGLAACIQNQQNAKRHVFCEQMTQSMQIWDSRLQFIRSAPLHNPGPAQAQILNDLKKINLQAETLPESHQRMAYFTLGYGYFLLRDFENAQAYLEKTQDLGEHQGCANCTLGHVLAHQYANPALNPDLGQSRLTLRDKALALLNSRPQPCPNRSIALALIAHRDGQFKQALSHIQNAKDEHPWGYETITLEIKVRLDDLTRRKAWHKPQDFQADFQRLQELAATAAQLGRSDDQVLALHTRVQAFLIFKSSENATLSPQDFVDRFKTARAACNLEGSFCETRIAYLKTLVQFAFLQLERGQNPEATLLEGQQLVKGGLQGPPQDAELAKACAAFELAAGRFHEQKKQFTKALDCLARSCQTLQPLRHDLESRAIGVEAHLLKGRLLARQNLAAQNLATGDHAALPDIERAEQLARELVEATRDDSIHWKFLGECLLERSHLERNYPHKSRSWREEAKFALERCLELSPNPSANRSQAQKLLSRLTPGRDQGRALLLEKPVSDR